VESHHLDERLDLRLRAAEEQRAPADAEPAGEHGEIEHQRRVSENELGEVDDDVGLRPDRARECTPSRTLR
jgi:hypothetical protein